MWQIAAGLPSMLHRILRLAAEADRRALAVVIATQAAAGVLTAVGLDATTGVLGPLFGGGVALDRLRAAVPALLLVGAATAGRALLLAVARIAAARLGPAVDNVAEQRLMETASRAELSAYDDPAWCDAREAAERGSKDAHDAVTALVSLLGALVSLLGAAGVLAHLHPLLVVLLVVAMLPRVWAAVATAREEHRAAHAQLSDRRERHSLLYYTIGRDSAVDVRAFDMSDFLLRHFRTVSGRLAATTARAGMRQGLLQLAGDTATGIGLIVVYATLGLLAARHIVPLAAIGTAVIAIQTGTATLTSLVRASNTSYVSGLYLADWAQFVNAPTTGRTAATIPRQNGPDTIRANNLTFTYPAADRPAVDGVNVEVRRGEVVAIVGENGSGKSTLARLLAGLYLPDEGAVTWDGTDTRRLPPAWLSKHLTLAPQDWTRWRFTARTNIALSDDVDDDAVWDAARAAGADTVLAALPHGLDTSLADSYWGGVDLSGGQWQRIALARAFHRDQATLLIADEPTSALDPKAEHATYQRIRELAEGRAVVLITHRLASTRNADRIYVLDHGRLIEYGSHEDLIGRGGTYAELYKLQSEAFGTT